MLLTTLLLKISHDSRGKVDSILVLRLITLADPPIIVRLIKIITIDLYIKKLVTSTRYTLPLITY
jgi:hypothetical protein